MNAEAELLLTCMRWGARRCEPRQVADTAQTVCEWDAFAALADAHSLAPLAADALRQADIAVPPALRRAFHENVKRVLTLTGELARVLRLLNVAGVNAIAFKGPVLAHSIYRDPAHRVFTDLDILVSPDQLQRALATLEADGYRSTADATVPKFMQPDSELHLRHRDRQIEVDLHWSLFPGQFPVCLPTSSAFSRSARIEIQGESVRTLSPEDTLLHLCAHAWKHSYVSLSLVQDLSCLNLSRRTFAADNASVLNLARQTLSDRACLHRILALDPYRTDMIGEMRFQWNSRCGVWPTAKWLLSRVLRPTPAEWASIRFPRPLHFLYYPLRMARLAVRRTQSLN